MKASPFMGEHIKPITTASPAWSVLTWSGPNEIDGESVSRHPSWIRPGSTRGASVVRTHSRTLSSAERSPSSSRPLSRVYSRVDRMERTRSAVKGGAVASRSLSRRTSAATSLSSSSIRWAACRARMSCCWLNSSLSWLRMYTVSMVTLYRAAPRIRMSTTAATGRR